VRRPFLIDVDKGAAIMARMIERQVGKRWCRCCVDDHCPVY
jgi:hypothetical protein